jgi:hypothetical protein
MTGGYAGGQPCSRACPTRTSAIKIENDALTDDAGPVPSDIFRRLHGRRAATSIPATWWRCVRRPRPVRDRQRPAAGAERVIAIDQYDYRCDNGATAGATDAINFAEDADIVEQLKQLTGGRGPTR